MKTFSIIGYGNQARAWAKNLRDSGWEIEIFLRSGSSSYEPATQDGFTVKLLEELKFSVSKYFAALIPDDQHQNFLENYAHLLPKESNIILAHGFSYVQNDLKNKFKNLNFILLAPKAIATELRSLYVSRGNLGAVYSLEALDHNHQETKKIIFDLALALGITVGPFESSFNNETNADLFSEQSILCGVIPYVANSAFKKLRAQGISKELAYFECWYEIKLIVDTLIKIGPKKFFDLISPNALYGSQLGQELLIDNDFDKKLDQLLENILDQKFQDKAMSVDMDQVRKETNEFWEKQELSEVHNELGSQLFGD